MPREKQGYRDTIEDLNRVFPDVGMLSRKQVAQYMGVQSGGEDMTEIMTDKQFDKIMKLVRMVLDGCNDLEEAKQKVDQLIEEQTNKKDD